MVKDTLNEQKKWTGIVLLVLICLFVVWFLFCTPVTPLAGNLRGSPSENPVPAAGFWGTIGFYRDSADNGHTYFLMALFFSMAVYKIIRSCFFTKVRQSHSEQEIKRTKGGLVSSSNRLREPRF